MRREGRGPGRGPLGPSVLRRQPLTLKRLQDEGVVFRRERALLINHLATAREGPGQAYTREINGERLAENTPIPSRSHPPL